MGPTVSATSLRFHPLDGVVNDGMFGFRQHPSLLAKNGFRGTWPTPCFSVHNTLYLLLLVLHESPSTAHLDSAPFLPFVVGPQPEDGLLSGTKVDSGTFLPIEDNSVGVLLFAFEREGIIVHPLLSLFFFFFFER